MSVMDVSRKIRKGRRNGVGWTVGLSNRLDIGRDYQVKRHNRPTRLLGGD